MRRFTWVLAWESDGGGEHRLPRWLFLVIVGLAVLGASAVLLWRFLT